MIKINLLGKKQAAAGSIPFGLDEKLGKLGITPNDLSEMRPGLVRLVLLCVGIYLCNVIPTHFHEQKKAELDAVLAGLAQESGKLAAELSTKKDIRRQMDQLNKEEDELRRQLNAVSALQKDRSLAFRTLDSMVLSLPQKVWLESIEYRERSVVLKGSCWEYFPINDFVKAINDSTQFTNVNFKGITTVLDGQKLIQGVPEATQKTKKFELEFKVKATGES